MEECRGKKGKTDKSHIYSLLFLLTLPFLQHGTNTLCVEQINKESKPPYLWKNLEMRLQNVQLTEHSPTFGWFQNILRRNYKKGIHSYT